MAKIKMKINEPLSTDEILAPTAITEEDMALDRELERLAMETPVANIDADLSAPLKKEKLELDHLRWHVGDAYKPAASLNELDQQVSVAKRLHCDSIDATDEIIYYYCGEDYARSHGFFMYKDIRVHFPEEYASAEKKSRMTVEQKLFGESKVK